MKLCQASFLLAVGWYLLMPAGGRTLRMAPRGNENWGIHSQYTNPSDCEQARQHLIDSLPDEPATVAPRSLRSAAKHSAAQRYREARCVAADDPLMHQLRPKSNPDVQQ